MRKNINIITLTESAANQIKYLLNKNVNNSAIAIRIGIKSGGCSGNKYTFEYANDKALSDKEIKEKGVTIFINSKTIPYLTGTILDYVEQKTKSKFIFKNPNEQKKCSCGESFSV